MTISAYTGLPGHGKSYGVVENVIVPALKSKRVVYTNIPINSDVCIDKFNISVIQFSIDEIISNNDWFSTVFEAGSIIVIDEIWRLWPSGLNAKSTLLQHKEFLAEHRHLVGTDGNSTEIVLVTQDLSQIASFARSLIETTFRTSKLSSLGLDKNFRIDVYAGCASGQNPPEKLKINTIQGRFKKEIFNLYKSHTKSSVGAGNEKRTDNRFNVLASKKVILFFLFISIMIYLSYKGLSGIKDDYTPEKPIKKSFIKNNTNEPNQNNPNNLKINSDLVPFLSNIKSINATSLIIKKNSNVLYNFNVVSRDFVSVINNIEFEKMGYKILFINKCLFKITGHDFNDYVGCEKLEEKMGIIQEMIVDTSK
jgi:zona occludens toxin